MPGLGESIWVIGGEGSQGRKKMKQREYRSLDKLRHSPPLTCAVLFGAALAVVPLRSWADSDDPIRFIPNTLVSSTIPPPPKGQTIGDQNPYGVAFVLPGFPAGGALKPGDILVSNFNNSSNTQGTGTTIINLRPSLGAAPDNQAKVFFQGTAPGLTLALGVLRRGIVIVGSVANVGGTPTAGPLLFINNKGIVIKQLDSSSTPKLNGPWGLAVSDNLSSAKLFVSNVLDGTVIRIDLSLPGGTTINVTGVTQVASGYQHRPDSTAFVVGPAGLFYDKAADVLYVAATAEKDNAIFKIAHAGTTNGSSGRGTLVFSDPHLRGPLALALAPNGHLLTSNGDAVNADPTQPSEIVEFTKTGQFIGQYNIHQNQGGAFGVATSVSEAVIAGKEVDIDQLAVVNDNTNNITVTTFVLP
jgi:hypothetical protein